MLILKNFNPRNILTIQYYVLDITTWIILIYNINIIMFFETVTIYVQRKQINITFLQVIIQACNTKEGRYFDIPLVACIFNSLSAGTYCKCNWVATYIYWK